MKWDILQQEKRTHYYLLQNPLSQRIYYIFANITQRLSEPILS